MYSYFAADPPKCPKECRCYDFTQFVNCSSAQLTSIPGELPRNALEIDLSNNHIEIFDVAELQNATVLRKLLLNHNKIHSIVNTEVSRAFSLFIWTKNSFANIHLSLFQAFVNLTHLDHINLASNALKNLSGSEFNDAQQLTMLTLNHNPLELYEGQVLVNVTNLEVLSLIGCNITELYNSTFAPNAGLLKLNLNKNPLPEVSQPLWTNRISNHF